MFFWRGGEREEVVGREKMWEGGFISVGPEARR